MNIPVPFVDLPALVASDKQAYLAAFDKILSTGGYIGGGAVESFEKAFAAYCGTERAASVKTGTDALLLALRAMGIGPGHEVITAANSFFATGEAIALAGATPVLADVSEDTLLIDPADAAKRITDKTKAIIPVHLFGQIADMAKINALAASNKLRVLEDAAQAHGATRKAPDGSTWKAGSCAEAAAFSFYPTKNLGALGEGGAITTKFADLDAKVKSLRDHGQAGRHDHVEVGYNARLDALQCACLEISLKRLDAGNEKRRSLAKAYRERLKGIVRMVAEAPGSNPVYHLMIVRVDAGARDKVREKLQKDGIATAIHYPTPIHQQKAFAHLRQDGCPVAERAAKEMISLPMFPDLTVEQVERVCDSLKRAL